MIITPYGHILYTEMLQITWVQDILLRMRM